MKQKYKIPIVAILATLMLVLPVAATGETLDNVDTNLPDLMVSNPRYYSATHDSPVLGAPCGIKFDITNIGAAPFNGKAIIWFSSDRYFSDTLPLNKNNIIEMEDNLYIVPGQTITVALANYRPWGELNKPGKDHFDFGVKTNALEKDSANNEGIYSFVVKPK